MKKTALFGLSANPPANHHVIIFEKLFAVFDYVVVIPRGSAPNKPSTAETSSHQRKEMTSLAFPTSPKVEIDFYDLNNNTFTPAWMTDKKYKAKFPDSEIWHVVGGDIVKGGASGNSQIQKKWQKGLEIWNHLNWAVIDHAGFPVDSKDLPLHNMVIKTPLFEGRSTLIREQVASGKPITNLVPPEVEKYIIENNLYQK